MSRTAITAVEGAQLVPSVAAALSVAEALGCTVEQLFGRHRSEADRVRWAWPSPKRSGRHWQAEVGGKIVLYPATTTPMSCLPADGTCVDDVPGWVKSSEAARTLVIAGCDPAAGMLASIYAQTTGYRLLVLPRSSRQAVQLLRDGLVHMAGLHLSTEDEPQRNAETVLDELGPGYGLLRMMSWQEGLAVSPSLRIRSVRGVVRSRLTWIGREPGSGARHCLDRLLAGRQSPRRVAPNHRGVAGAIHSGWADAGVCIRLTSEEEGLDFLPVQTEAYDLCFAADLEQDARFKALLGVVRSPAYRKMMGELPGYDTSETGSVSTVRS